MTTERDEYRTKMEAQLVEYAERIGQLVGRAEKAAGDLKTQSQNEITALRAKQERARQELGRLKDASEDAWRDLRAGLERAWEDLRQSIEQASARFK